MVIRLTLAFPPAATKLLVGIYVTPAEVLLLRALLGSQARIRAPGDARGPGVREGWSLGGLLLLLPANLLGAVLALLHALARRPLVLLQPEAVLELLHGLDVVVDLAEPRRLPPPELRAEPEQDDGLLVLHAVHLRHLLSELLLGHVRPPRVQHIHHELAAREQPVGDELPR